MKSQGTVLLYSEVLVGGDDNTRYEEAIPEEVKLTRRGNSQVLALH